MSLTAFTRKMKLNASRVQQPEVFEPVRNRKKTHFAWITLETMLEMLIRDNNKKTSIVKEKRKISFMKDEAKPERNTAEPKLSSWS